MNKKIFNSLAVACAIATLFYACSKKDKIDDPVLPCANNLAPANGSSTTSGSVTLSWSAVSGAKTYDVYAGTTTNAINLVASDIAATAYVYTLPPSATNTYYWYVVPKGDNKVAPGCSSKFTSFKRLSPIPPPSMGFMVINYFSSYRTVAEYPDRMFKMCNVVNYAFADITASSTIDIANAGTTFTELLAKAKRNGAKVFLSIYSSSDNFKLLADIAKRNILAKDIMTKLRTYNLDGIDMDYEYPRTDDGTSATFTLLMKELSDSLHAEGKYYLSAAITPGRYAGAIRDGISAEVFAYVDFFNVMVYDDFSTSVPYKHHSSMSLVDHSTNYWLNTRGMPKEKFVLGIPVYGRNSDAAQVATPFKTILNTGTQLGPAAIHLSDSATLHRHL